MVDLVRKSLIEHEFNTLIKSYGCNLVVSTGLNLGLSTIVLFRAQMLLQRFYHFNLPHNLPVQLMTTVCLWLSCKLEENHGNLIQILNINQDQDPHELVIQIKSHFDYEISIRITNLKVKLTYYEIKLLRETGFHHSMYDNLKIKSSILQILSCQSSKIKLYFKDIMKCNCHFYRTRTFLRFSPSAIVTGIAYFLAQKNRIKFPERPSWWRVFTINIAEMQQIVRRMSEVYLWQPKKCLEDILIRLNRTKEPKVHSNIHINFWQKKVELKLSCQQKLNADTWCIVSNCKLKTQGL